ncbi:putative sulfate exporter family transporter [Weissella diestrammenae]|uniref:Putative sulfate exporter family transporter n=1 Tax=Weissella diestrammenae TaxID=1162633 RepID=A0A7G9T754_9LACO|nr:putative sulfate exporter family transporter [Weissella diestrammenae]MCM0582470.1 putative sulfate exporter family transporter [Weissella diestrammenae]QNN75929.1 putative sulfate exporter family transporter [Weissella diestrammenae]
MAIRKNMLPGIIATIILSVLAKIITPFISFLGAEAIAMIGGIILGNTLLKGQRWHSGVKWAEKYPIEIGIALLGLTTTLSTIQALGLNGIGFILILMTLTIVFVTWIGLRWFKVSPGVAMLMGAGNAVCGSSAIASVAPAIGATDDERRTSVATVSIMGVILLLTLPTIGPLVFNHDNLLIGALIGGTVQSVGQVVGTASLVNSSVVAYATLFKMVRVILLSVVVIALANFAHRKDVIAAQSEMKPVHQKVKIPWFIIAFIILMLISSFITLPHVITISAKETTGFFGIVNLAGIGLNLKWETIKAAGGKLFAFGLVTIVFQILVAITLIKVIM